LVFFTFIIAWLTVTSAMTTVPAVTEHVHRDKGDENQHAEPDFRKPCHNFSPSGWSSRILVNNLKTAAMLRQLSAAAFVLSPIDSYFFITPFTGVLLHLCYLLSLVCVFGPRTIKTEHSLPCESFWMLGLRCGAIMWALSCRGRWRKIMLTAAITI
jgi:hypothetical protein